MDRNLHVTALVASNGSLWVGTRSGLWHFLPDVPFFMPVPGVEVPVLEMRQLDADHLWFRTPEGMFILTLVDDKVFAAPDEVHSPPMAAFAARDAFYFLLDSALYCRRDGAMARVELPAEAPLLAFLQRGDDELWLGGDGWVCRYDLASHESELFTARIGRVHSLLELAGSLFIGMDSGVRRLDLQTRQFEDNARLSNLPRTTALRELEGRPLAVSERALYLYAPDRVEARAASFWIELPSQADHAGPPAYRAVASHATGLWVLADSGPQVWKSEESCWRSVPLELASGRRVPGELLCVTETGIWAADGDALFRIDPEEMRAHQQAWPFVDVDPGGQFPDCLTRDAVLEGRTLYFLKGGVDSSCPGRVWRCEPGAAEARVETGFGEEVWGIQSDAKALWFLGPRSSCRFERESGQRRWFGLRWPGGEAHELRNQPQFSYSTTAQACHFPLLAFTPDGQGGGFCAFGPYACGYPELVQVPGGVFRLAADGTAARLVWGDEHPNLREPRGLALDAEGGLLVAGRSGLVRLAESAEGWKLSELDLPAASCASAARAADLLVLGPPLLWTRGAQETPAWQVLDGVESSRPLASDAAAPAGSPALAPLQVTADEELVWVATGSGLLRLGAEDQVRLFDGRNGFYTNKIYSVTRVRDRLLVGTSHGIFSLRR